MIFIMIFIIIQYYFHVSTEFREIMCCGNTGDHREQRMSSVC